jgi:hypothetical protein
VRSNLVSGGFLSPDDWGLYHGFTWINEPGAVLVKDGVVFVDAGALRAAGIPFELAGEAVVAAGQRRRGRIPIGRPGGASARRGFRDQTGKVYLPIEEFDRQEVYEVQVQKGAQMVEIWLEPPHHREE